MIEDIDVKDLGGDFSYEPRQDWAKKYLTWDRDKGMWEIPGTEYSKVAPGGVAQANHESFRGMYNQVKSVEDDARNVSLYIDQAGLEALPMWRPFQRWVLMARSHLLIDEDRLNDVNWQALEQQWKAEAAAETARLLWAKFGDQFRSPSAFQDLEDFLVGPNGLRWFFDRALEQEPDWDDAVPPKIYPGDFIDGISFEDVKNKLYGGQNQPSFPGWKEPAGDQGELRFEGLEDEDKNLIRGIKRSTPQFVIDFMNENFPWDEEHEMWELGGFCNFGGGLADRANCAYFEKKYPGLVTTEYGGLGSETVGIKKAALARMDSDTLDSLAADLARIGDSVIIDDEAAGQMESELRQEAWDNWVSEDFVRGLRAKFPQHEELIWEYKSDPLMRALFEDAREKAGEEWFEESDSGGRQYVRVNAILAKVDERTVLEWLEGIAESSPKVTQLVANFAELFEEINESRKYSVVMAPASPELSDAVIRWGEMFITEDKLHHDQKDPEGFGREHDVHVTVKFGLHEPEPSQALLDIIEQTEPFEIEVGPCSLFDTNPDFDVVKFDCDGQALRALNERISQLKNSDSHPEYRPHMTVAYVTKGSCAELVGKPLFNENEPGAVRFLVKTVLFRGAAGEKISLFLGKPNLELAT